MPFVQISVPAGSLSPEQKTAMIAKVTDACVEAEGIPAVRAQTFVHIAEVPDGGWGIGGRAVTLAMMKAALSKG
ncbi:MAG: 4-oxalocrotonate tautomerase family protein [Alphaproteobacteria bacterium]